jgi:ribonuclease D
MEPVVVIEKPSELHALVQKLSESSYLAVDTESNSFHAYFEQICLIQISTSQTDYIIDPLALKDINLLKEVFANPGIEKIFHAASNDISGFRRDFSFHFQNLFDTAVAAKLLGYKKLGLATLLNEHFGVQLDKKWQRYDWAKRPLTREQIEYARLDTHYLIPLRHSLAESLHKKQVWEKAQELFPKACEQEVQEKVFQPEGYLNIRGAHHLDTMGKSILQSLYLYRDHEARRRNKAPFRILSNAVLLKLARYRPTQRQELYKIRGLPHLYRKPRAALELLEVIGGNKQGETGHEFSETLPPHIG